MNMKVSIAAAVLSAMNSFLEREKLAEKAGDTEDLRFIVEGRWLKDSAVIDGTIYRNGGWDVYLVFVHYTNALQLIVRTITRCYSEPKAKATAFYIRKEAAKDRRGTLGVSIQMLGLCTN